MKYNFDEIIERRQTNAMNTDGFRSYIFHAGPEKKFPFADDEFVRMWVADMEFETPPEVCQAIKDRVDKRIFGYTQVFDPKYYDAISTWCKRLYDWEFPKEELTFSPGIIPALYELVGDILEPDEKMIINTPSYGFFKHSATYNNRELVHNDLKNDNGYFTMNFEDLEKKAADPKAKLLLWCNPHNPTGRMWTESELKKVADIVEKYDLWIISDEIHCDLIRQGKKHIPMGKVMPTYNKLITCMATSKTFNMAGLMFSNIIIRDSKLRQTFKDNDKNIGFVNPISLAANQAAYEKGGEWLEQLKSYLDNNFKYVQEYLAKNLSNAVFSIPEATYLAWVDLRKCIPDIDDLATFFANEAGVLLEGGNDLFVGNAEGFIRLNLAMPKAIIEEGLKRIVEAINKHNGK
jgi:cystathionine beta-lyase